MSEARGGAGTPRSWRPTVMAARHLAAAGHYWSAQAAFQILEAGGNAIDAGVAAGLATCVLESEFVGFAGVAPAIFRLARTREVLTVSGVGPWPQAASCDYFHRHHGGRVPEGILHSVVPAAPAIWITLLEKYGTLSFGAVAATAIRFARDGFPMYPMFRERVDELRPKLAAWPSTADVFLPGGRLPAVGEIFRQPDLAATLQYLVDEETAAAKRGRVAGLAAARDAFYKGDIAARMIRHQKELGGLMTMDDLAAYRAEFEPPCRIRFADADVYSCGPWCQGPMILAALNILEGIDLKAMGHNTPDYLHAIVEALKLAAADREAYYGDPKFVEVPLATLLAKDYAAQRRKLIDPRKAFPGMPPFGKVAGFDLSPWRPDPSTGAKAAPTPSPETSYLCVVDKEGNVFSATPSDPCISGPVIPGTGISPSMWGSRAYTDSRHPASVGPGRRPRMSANPMLAIRADGALIPFGSPGSEVLGQAQIQVFLNMMVFGMTPQEAVEQPRLASYSWPASQLPHPYYPGRLMVEASLGDATIDGLAARGHEIQRWPERKWLAGSVCTIVAEGENGVRHGGADPRRTAYVVGW